MVKITPKFMVGAVSGFIEQVDPRGNLYEHLLAKRKGVYGFQGDLNPVGSEGSSLIL